MNEGFNVLCACASCACLSKINNIPCSVSAPRTAPVSHTCLMGDVRAYVRARQITPVLTGCLAEILPVTALVWYHLEEIKSWCFIE